MTEFPNLEPSWTVSKVLAFATADFQKRGIEGARLESEILLCDLLRTNRMQLLLDAERPLSKAELTRYRALIEPRCRRPGVTRWPIGSADGSRRAMV